MANIGKVLCALLLTVIAGGCLSKTAESILFEDVKTFKLNALFAVLVPTLFS